MTLELTQMWDQDQLTYTLDGPDAALFGINPASGQLRLGDGTKLDHESDDTYTVTVTATDSSLATDMVTVTIKVIDVNEAPTIDMVEQLRVRGETRHTFNENETGNVATFRATGPSSETATWSVTGADRSFFSIAGGVLSLDSQLNFESPADANRDNVYEVTVVAEADGMNRGLDVEVTLENVEEPGNVTLSSDPVRVGVELIADLRATATNRPTSPGNGPEARPPPATFTDILRRETNNTYTPVDPADVANFLQITVTYDDPHGTSARRFRERGDVGRSR